MKPQTIKALQELCGQLMRLRHFPSEETEELIARAADRLKRVLDEEKPDEAKTWEEPD